MVALYAVVRFDFVLTLSDAPAGASSAPAPPHTPPFSSISRGFLKIEWAAGRGQTAHFFPYEPFMGRSEPLKCKNTIADATGCEQCLRIDVELLPAIRRAGYLARARPAVSVRLRRSSEWGGHTHPPLHRASAPKTLVCSACLAVRPFASSLYRFQVCLLAAGLIYPPLRSRLCLGFWSLLARCSSPHPRLVFHFGVFVHSWLVHFRGPASVQRSLARYPARPEGIYFTHAPV